MGKGKTIKVFWIVIFFTATHTLRAQPISIDRGLRAGDLWCFPLATDSTTWLYLPDQGLLALDDNKKPQFSYIRYVKPVVKPVSEDVTVTTADGGAVLHFLVTYDTDPRRVASAEEKLNELLPGSSMRIRGPVIFQSGRYALVSSAINGGTGKEEKQLLSTGAAPVLQGSRIALSFELNPERAKLLLESLKMPTPDISIVFDMTFSGLTDAYKAKMTVDWSLVNKSRKIGGGISLYYVSLDLEDAYEELRRTGAILLEAEGEDERMEKLVNDAYSRLTDMMFQKIEPEQLSDQEQDGLAAALSGLFGGDAAPARKFTGFGANAVYKRKNIRTSGASTLYFSSRRSAERHHYFTFNMGSFYKKYGENEDYIRTVSLARLDDQVRHIAVGVDGGLLPEFDKLINHVTIKLRKVHEDGSVTIDEQSITRQRIDKQQAILLSYGAVKDTDPLRWMEYEYNAQFNFRGGKNWETGWVKQDMNMINLLTPYERRTVKLEGDMESLRSKNVRATSIRIEFPFLGENRTIEQTVMTGEDLSQKIFEITLPRNHYGYKYFLRWHLKDGTQRTAAGEAESGILFIDGIPAN